MQACQMRCQATTEALAAALRTRLSIFATSSARKWVGVAGLRGTKWENCLHFFMNFPGEHTQPILFSPKTDPKKLLAYEKKVPEFQLLAVVVHGRILSKAGVQDLVNMPDLATQRAELSTLLSFNQRKTLSLLGANQQSLSTNLDQYVKDRTT